MFTHMLIFSILPFLFTFNLATISKVDEIVKDITTSKFLVNFVSNRILLDASKKNRIILFLETKKFCYDPNDTDILCFASELYILKKRMYFGH